MAPRALLFLLAALAPWGLQAEAYALKLSVTAHGPWIKAGDVLRPAPTGKLASVKIKHLDGPGKSAEISRDLVMLKVREARLKGLQVSISGTSCVATGSSRTVQGADIRAFAEKYLRERLAPLSGAAEVEMIVKDAPQDLLVPDRTVRLELLPPAGGRFRGNVILRILAHQTDEDGGDLMVGQSVISALVKVRQKQLVSTRPIRRGELISAQNAALAMVDATYSLEDGYSTLDEAAGLKCKTYIGADKQISPQMLERPPVIKRGDIVKLEVRAGLISVKVTAKALRDAALGDSIPVEVVESKKQVQARVLDQGTVVSESR